MDVAGFNVIVLYLFLCRVQWRLSASVSTNLSICIEKRSFLVLSPNGTYPVSIKNDVYVNEIEYVQTVHSIFYLLQQPTSNLIAIRIKIPIILVVVQNPR